MANSEAVPLSQKILLTVEEAANLLSLSRTQAYELVKQGVIPSIKLGERSTRISRVALEQWALTATTSRPQPNGVIGK